MSLATTERGASLVYLPVLAGYNAAMFPRSVPVPLVRHNPPAHRVLQPVVLVLVLSCCTLLAAGVSLAAGEESGDLDIAITKIGLGKEVVITAGALEWFMRVEVTPENTVVVRQEKQGDRYLIDESETHDRSMTAAEVDAAINDFINHVKVKHQTP
jgi:hypothetical protein